MANPFNNILSPQLLDTYDNAIRGLINGLKTNCKLYFPVTKWVDCSCDNSVFNNSPNPFLKGKQTTSCPQCGGNNKIESEETQDIQLCIYFDYKKFDKIANVNIVKGDAYSISEIDDTQKIKQCKYIILDSDKQQLKTRKFKLKSEIQVLGFRNNFFQATWEVI